MRSRHNLAQWYFGALRARRRLRRATGALFDGFWLGMMTPHDLRAVSEMYYATAREDVAGSAVRYTQPEHIAKGLSDWERSALDDLRPGATVVVTSAGAGREVHALVELGLDAYGYEPDHRLVTAGHSVLADPRRLQRCEWDMFPPHPGPVDAVVVGWGSYMLIPSRERRSELLREARAVLRPGGLLLVSYFLRPPTAYFSVVRTVGSAVRRARGLRQLDFGDALSPNFVHYFTEEEIASDLSGAGFEVVRQRAEPYAHTVARGVP